MNELCRWNCLNSIWNKRIILHWISCKPWLRLDNGIPGTKSISDRFVSPVDTRGKSKNTAMWKFSDLFWEICRYFHVIFFFFNYWAFVSFSQDVLGLLKKKNTLMYLRIAQNKSLIPPCKRSKNSRKFLVSVTWFSSKFWDVQCSYSHSSNINFTHLQEATSLYNNVCRTDQIIFVYFLALILKSKNWFQQYSYS